MKVKAVEKKVCGPQGKQLQVSFEDLETGLIYGRVVNGFAWPHMEKPGCVVALAESFERDHSIPHSPFHLYVLEDFYSSDLEEIFRCLLRHRETLSIRRVYGNPDSPLISLWRALGREGSRININKPPNLEAIVGALNFTMALVRKHTSTRKTLHFLESSLSQHLSTIPVEETEGKNLEYYPPICALGFALSVMERAQTVGQFVPQRRKSGRGARRG